MRVIISSEMLWYSSQRALLSSINQPLHNIANARGLCFVDGLTFKD
jgi:hypothetical protein